MDTVHQFIRYIIPKGISFDDQRSSLDYQTPYQLFKKIYGKDISIKLYLKEIKK